MAQMTLQEAFALACGHHQAGRLPEAERIYRQILGVQPAHPGALHHLGLIALQFGRADLAVQLIGQSLALQPHSADAESNLGSALCAQGRLEEAVAACRRALALDPSSPEAHCTLGNALKDQGHLPAAVDAYREAIARRPDFPDAHGNLGNVLRLQGQLAEAVSAFRQALALRPDFAPAHSNLGNALRDQGLFEEAIAAFCQAILLQPRFAEAHNNLGNALKDQGHLVAAIAAYRQAAELQPQFPEAHNNLGAALFEHGQLEAARAACEQALALRPGFAEAHGNLGNIWHAQGHAQKAIAAYRQALALQGPSAETLNNLGNVLRECGQAQAAAAACRQALALQPQFAKAHCNLGNALKDMGQVEEATAAFRNAIALRPTFAEAHNNLGNALKDLGLLEEAVAAYRQSITLQPEFSQAHSNLIFCLHYLPGVTATLIAGELRRWAERHADPLGAFVQPHANRPERERRLRIGYVSPDLRDHPVGHFLLPLLARHDPARVEIFAYAQVAAPDALTDELRRHTHAWRNLVGVSDQAAADLIREDGIDILVDLAMHTSGHRLLVFAHQPAPVQVTWMGYPGSTGLGAIQYRISDPFLDPPGADDGRCYREETIRLRTFWCYRPWTDLAPAALPALSAGTVTFGCLNNFCKVNEPLLALWARVLRAVPNSRLLLQAPEGGPRQRVRAQLAAAGLEPERVGFIGRVAAADYYAAYGTIDIALDPAPYGGGTTTCDALWMGVPVVTLNGALASARAGASLLCNLGHPEWVAETGQEYVAIAASLAADLPRLTALRAGLRAEMAASPLMDEVSSAREVEAAYRQMWTHWCTGRD